MHIAVDTKTKQILAIEVTHDDVGDGRMLGRLVKDSAAAKAFMEIVKKVEAYLTKRCCVE